VTDAITVQDVGIRFHRTRARNRPMTDLIRRSKEDRASGQFWALRDVTFTVEEGEAVGVVGANGQGKSTLLSIIAGVLLPDEGWVEVNGGVAPLISITGGFKDDLTVRDNINVVAGLHGMSKEEIANRFDDIIEFAEIGDFVDTPFRFLSSGMRVRLAFSVITSIDEPIILVDEVLAVGDSEFRKKCMGRLDEMLTENKTLFLVSHSDRALERFCRRGLYLRRGQLIADAPITEILERYAADRIIEGHPGWQGERRRARRERQRRRRERMQLLAEGKLVVDETVERTDDEMDGHVPGQEGFSERIRERLLTGPPPELTEDEDEDDEEQTPPDSSPVEPTDRAS
jgi:ABC-2 type transport system ATP-binding protein